MASSLPKHEESDASVRSTADSQGNALPEGRGSIVAFRRLLSASALEKIYPAQPAEETDVGYADEQATCAVLHEQALLVGTRRGHVWAVRRAHGHWTSEMPVQVCRHAGAVTDVSLDESGCFSASSASDGSVSVGPLVSGEEGWQRWVHIYPRPVLSVAICPTYGSGAKASGSVCLGGEECKLILNRRGAFESRNLTVHAGEGAIAAVRWRGTLIAWANAKGVKVVDIETYQKVTHIPWPCLPPGGNAAPCTLTWSSDDVLLISYGPLVMIAEVRQKQGVAGVRFASLTHSFQFPSGCVLGLAAFDSEHLSVLTSGENGKRETVAHHVCGWTGEVFCSERVPCTDRGSLLVSACAGQLAMVVTARDIISIERRSVTEHVEWLIKHAHYESAIALVSQTTGAANVAEKCRVCIKCVRPLLARGEPARAARVARHFGCSAAAEVDAWELCVRLFDEAGELLVLVPEIPVPPRWSQNDKGDAILRAASARLPCNIYDKVLNRLAAISPGAFCAALDRWPSHIYSAGPLMESLRTALPSSITSDVYGDSGDSSDIGDHERNEVEDLRLAEALASLHEAQDECVVAVKLLARVDSNSLFPFIARHIETNDALREDLSQDLCPLFDLDPDKSLMLFVDHPGAFKPQEVVAALARRGRQWQYHYVTLLASRNPAAALPLKALHAELMAELEPHGLQSLVRVEPAVPETRREGVGSAGVEGADEVVAGGTVAGEQSDFDEALLKASREHGAFGAEAALLAQKGEWRGALEVLLRELGDVEGILRMVADAPSERAPDLWAVLLTSASSDQRSFSLLLARLACGAQALPVIGTSPRSLVKQLPSTLEIPKLGAKLASALDEAEADRDVHRLTLEMVKGAAAAQSLKLFKQQRRGRAVAGRDNGGQRVAAPVSRERASKKVPEKWVSALRAVADGVRDGVANL